MDASSPSANTGVSFLSECVSPDMPPAEAVQATTACWIEAEKALTPLLGHDGVKIVFREGENLAARTVGEQLPPACYASIAAFSEWARTLEPRKAVAACVAFLSSVERYLANLLGVRILRQILRRKPLD